MPETATPAKRVWPVLIKADDLSINSDLDVWDRFLDVVKNHARTCDIGVILKPAEPAALNPLRSWLARHAGVAGFFDHGTEHTHEEFKSDLDRQGFAARFRTLAELEHCYFGHRLEGFGAPYNSLCAAAIAAYFDVNPDGFIYYPDRDPVNEGVASGRLVSIKHHVSFERRELGDDPSYDYFRRTHQGRIATRQPLVLQVHPGRWSPRGFDEFAAILKHLRRQGASFLTARKFVATTHAAPAKLLASPSMPGASDPATIARQAGGWFARRFEPLELEKTRALVEQLLCIRPSQHWQGASALDLGCGIGDWLYLLRRGAPFAHLYGLEPRADVAELARRILDADDVGRYRVIEAAVGGDFALESRCALTVCNRALNYFDVIAYLDLLAAHATPDALHFIGYQTFAFYWCGLRSALTQGDPDIARRRVRVLEQSLRRLAGLGAAGRNQELVLPTTDLITLMALHGQRLVRRFPVQRHASGAVMVDGLAFETSEETTTEAGLVSRELHARLVERAAPSVGLLPLPVDAVERISRLGQAHQVGDTSIGSAPLDILLTGLELFLAGRHEVCLEFLKAHPDPGW